MCTLQDKANQFGLSVVVGSPSLIESEGAASSRGDRYTVRVTVGDRNYIGRGETGYLARSAAEYQAFQALSFMETYRHHHDVFNRCSVPRRRGRGRGFGNAARGPMGSLTMGRGYYPIGPFYTSSPYDKSPYIRGPFVSSNYDSFLHNWSTNNNCCYTDQSSLVSCDISSESDNQPTYLLKQSFITNPSNPLFINQPSNPLFINQPSNQPFINQPSDQSSINQPSIPPFITQPSNQSFITQPSDPPSINQSSNSPFITQPSNPPFIIQPSDQPSINQPSNPSFISQPSNPPSITQPSNPPSITQPSNPPSITQPSNQSSDDHSSNQPSPQYFVPKSREERMNSLVYSSLVDDGNYDEQDQASSQEWNIKLSDNTIDIEDNIMEQLTSVAYSKGLCVCIDTSFVSRRSYVSATAGEFTVGSIHRSKRVAKYLACKKLINVLNALPSIVTLSPPSSDLSNETLATSPRPINDPIESLSQLVSELQWPLPVYVTSPYETVPINSYISTIHIEDYCSSVGTSLTEEGSKIAAAANMLDILRSCDMDKLINESVVCCVRVEKEEKEEDGNTSSDDDGLLGNPSDADCESDGNDNEEEKFVKHKESLDLSSHEVVNDDLTTLSSLASNVSLIEPIGPPKSHSDGELLIKDVAPGADSFKNAPSMPNIQCCQSVDPLPTPFTYNLDVSHCFSSIQLIDTQSFITDEPIIHSD